MASTSHKRKQKRQPSRKSSRPVRQTTPPSNTAIATTHPGPREIVIHKKQHLSQDQIELLRRTVAKGTSDDEFSLFLLICRKHKVDPFIGQIHCVMFNVTKHHKEKRPTQDGKGEIEVWMPGQQMVIIMGINGYRSIAARNHKDFGGCDEPEFVMSFLKTPAGKTIPEKCTIKLWKKGLEHPVVATVYWDEFAPKDLNDSRADFWNRMPKHKLALCAESHAIRKGYPDLANIYTEDEMEQTLQDYTPGGRQITDEAGFAPSGVPVTWEARNGSTQAAQVVADAKSKGIWCDRHKCLFSLCPADEHTATENEAMLAAENKAKQSPAGVPGAAWKKETDKKADAPPPQRIVTVRWSSGKREFASITGDDAAIKFLEPDIKKWKGSEYLEGDKVWTISAEHVVSLEERCAIAGFGFQEISGPPPVPPGKAGDAKSAGASDSPKTDAPLLASGSVKGIRTGLKTKKGAEYISVLFNGTWTFCFNKDLWDFLQIAKETGFTSVLMLKKIKDFTNIIGIKSVGSREFEPDGKTPIIQMKEERPKPGQLFA